MRTDDNGKPMKDFDPLVKCECDNRIEGFYNYSMMWHEADIICDNCGGFIRYWDAG